MNLNPDSVAIVMNTAIQNLVATGVPVTPENHYARLYAWLEELEGIDHPNAAETRVLIIIALVRVNDILTSTLAA